MAETRQQPRISVVIPSYNTSKYIEHCLDSLLDQTFKDFEIIVVDDGSTDETLEILNWYKRNFGITVLTQKNQFAGVARNNGMKQAVGKYVLFLDSDDFFEPDFLESMHAAISQYDADVCICDGYILDDKTGQITPADGFLKTNLLPKNKKVFSARDIPDRIFSITSPAPWNMLYKKSFLEQHCIEFENTYMSNDLRFFGVAIALANKITTIDKRLVTYRYNHGNNLQSKNNRYPLMAYNSVLQIKTILEEKGVLHNVEVGFANFIDDEFSWLLSIMGKDGPFQKLQTAFFGGDLAQFAKLINEKNSLNWEHHLCLLSYKDMVEDIEQDEKQDVPFIFLKNSAKKQYAISVIVPVYNSEKYLPKCLKALQGQSLFNNTEIILVDDGSQDNSVSIIKKWSSKKNNVTIIQQANCGCGAARNTGLAYARGKYVYFLDSDDEIEKQTLGLLYNTAEKDGLDILLFDRRVEYDSESLKNKIKYEKKPVFNSLFVCNGDSMFKKLTESKCWTPCVPFKFFNRDFLVKNQLTFLTCLHEDELFSLKAILLAKKVKVIPDELYIRKVHASSIMTNSNNKRHFEGYFEVLVRMFNFINNKKDIFPCSYNYVLKTAEDVAWGVNQYYLQMSENERLAISFEDPEIALIFKIFARQMNYVIDSSIIKESVLVSDKNLIKHVWKKVIPRCARERIGNLRKKIRSI